MVIVKIMWPGDGEEIHIGRSVGFNPCSEVSQRLHINSSFFLREDDVAYVMNANNKIWTL
nr:MULTISPECIES: hypothetical protein [unclassified Pantoea]